MFSRAPWFPAFLAGCFGSWVLCGPALLHPLSQAATSLYSEGPGHLWGLWLAARDFPEFYGFVRTADVAWPDTFASHLMDPINLLIFGPGYLAGGGGLQGAMIGWNLLHGLIPLVGAFSVWQLTRRLVGDHPSAPWAAFLGTLAFVASPYFVLYPQMGRTEYLPAVLYPLHLAFLHRWLRRPSALEEGTPGLDTRPPLWVGLAAAGTLGAAALGGWYLAVFMAIADATVGLFWARGLPWREAIWRLALVAVLGILMTAPAALALVNFGVPVDLEGLTMEPTRCFPAAVLFRRFDVEPGPRLDFEPYIGILPIVAAVFVAVRRPRRESAWLVAALICLTFSLGRKVAWNPPNLGACESGVPSPLELLTTLVPNLRAMRSWTRIMVLASAFGAGALILSTALLWRRLGRLAIPVTVAAGLLVVVDNTTYPLPMTWPPPTFDPTPPVHLRDALSVIPAGPVVTLPLDIRLRQVGLEEHGLWNLWQLEMGRPVSAGALGATDSTQGNLLSKEVAAQQLATIKAHGGSGDRAAVAGNPPAELPSEADLEALRDGSIRLMVDGFAGVVLAEDMEAGGDLRRLLIAGLGPPAYDFGGVLTWNLHDLPARNYLDEPGDNDGSATNLADVRPAGR